MPDSNDTVSVRVGDGGTQYPIVSQARILAVHWFDVCSPWRITFPLGRLKGLGCEVREASVAQAVDVDDADLVVLHRPNTREAVRLIRDAREQGVPVVVDVDDLFLHDQLPPNAPFSKSWHPLFKRWEAEAQVSAGLAEPAAVTEAPLNAVMDRFHECLRLADLVTVSTAALADAYAPFNPAVGVLPNYYDDTNPAWRLRRPPRSAVHVGFAGTDHHLDNLAVLRGALEPVLQAHPAVKLVEAGGPALLPMVDAPADQLVHLGALPFETFPLLLHQMDVVLAPLADEPFARCKSNIRCMMAGLVGAPVVASPVGPYAEYIEEGVNGFLPRSTAEWRACVERLVADPVLRLRMGEANRRKAHDYAISDNAWRWAEMYESVLGRRRRA